MLHPARRALTNYQKNSGEIMKILKLITLIASVFLLTACAKSNLKTPCPNFGSHCRKVPINVWDYES